MDAYIKSYFGKNNNTQHTRQALHYQQLCVLLQTPGIEHIHILAQDYDNTSIITKPKNYLALEHPRITYHHTEQLMPSQARNRLMDIFYASGKDWALFADNDAIIDPRFHGKNIIHTIEHNTEWLTKNIDILVPMSPRHQPFNKYIQQEYDKGNLNTHTPIKRVNYCKTTLFWMKNRSKIGKAPIKFDEATILRGLEDFDYIGRVLENDGVMYQLQAVVMGDMGISEEISTLFESTDRTAQFEKVKEYIYKKYFDANDWQGVDKTKFNWSNIGNNKMRHSTYKLPLVGQDQQVLYTQDNLFHNMFEVEV